jgi:hypothetical protein
MSPERKKNMRFKSICLFAILFISLFSAYPLSAQSERPTNVGDSAPPVLTIPAGALVTVRTTQLLSSDRNRPGDEFTVTLDKPVIVQGWVVARQGQDLIGRVVQAQKAGRGKSDSQLAIELIEMVLVDGQQAPVRTELVQVLGRSTLERDQVATVGATTGIGAVIGAAAGGGEGAAIGAAIGAVAGVAGVLNTRGRPTEIYPETGLAFRLQNPVTISTENSRQAFLPVEQRDYSTRTVRNPNRYPEPAPRPRVYYYSPYDYDYWYDSPTYGLYFGYYRPYYHISPRVYVYPEHRRHR